MQDSNISRALLTVEQRGELFSAATRLLIAVILLAAGQITNAEPHGSHVLTMIGGVYALISVPGLVFALRKIYNAYLSYVYVFIDMLAIAWPLTMLANMHEIDATHELSLPIFTLTFVVLIHAALRYRPKLLLFGAMSFTVLLLVLPFLLETTAFLEFRNNIHNHHSFLERLNAIPHDVGFLPLIFLLLSGVLLFYIVSRARELVSLALVDERLATQLLRFFSPDVARELVSSRDGELAGGHRQQAAILFIDIRDFSTLSETISPEDVAELLSSFRSTVCETIFDHGGTVDKFIGDAVLAVFGTPVPRPDDANRAIKAIFEIRRSIDEWHEVRRQAGLAAVKAGIGGHYGEVFAGVIESGQIMEHTVIGNSVNVAQRLERLTREHVVDIAISDQLLRAACVNANEFGLRPHQNISLPGHHRKFTVWFAKDGDPLVKHA